jgi:4-diphosphocytidyl-2-C-methyl-D-erythritol kinase
MRLWRMAPDPATLARIAAGLGADVPVCLASQPRRMGGIGERLDAAPVLPDCGIVLVNPGVAVATAAVFRARRGDWSAPALLPGSWPGASAMAADLARLRNDLEPAATSLQPVIGEVLAALDATPGCLLTRMAAPALPASGLVADAEAAQCASAAVGGRGGVWVVRCRG